MGSREITCKRCILQPLNAESWGTGRFAGTAEQNSLGGTEATCNGIIYIYNIVSMNIYISRQLKWSC